MAESNISALHGMGSYRLFKDMLVKNLVILGIGIGIGFCLGLIVIGIIFFNGKD